MSRNTGLIFIVILVSVFNFSMPAAFAQTNPNEEIKNKDKPLKGEWDFQLRKAWETYNAGDDILLQVSDIEVADDGRVYLYDLKYHKFFVFSPEGEFLFAFGKQGEGPGEYKMVFNFFLEGKYVIAPEMGRFHYFTMDGKYVRTNNPGVMIFPRNFIDENRFITIQEQENGKGKPEKLQIFDLTSKERTTLAEVTAEKALTARAGGMALVLKDSSSTPSIVAGVRNNEIYYGKSDKYLIKKIDFKGKESLKFSIQGRERKKIPTAVKRKRFDNLRINNMKPSKEMVDQLIKGMPDYCTYFSRILIDENGLVYIFVNDMTNDTGQEIDIFSPQGKYLYHSHVTLPEGLRWQTPYEFEGNNLYIFTEDEEGEKKLVKYKIVKPSLGGA